MSANEAIGSLPTPVTAGGTGNHINNHNKIKNNINNYTSNPNVNVLGLISSAASSCSTSSPSAAVQGGKLSYNKLLTKTSMSPSAANTSSSSGSSTTTSTNNNSNSTSSNLHNNSDHINMTDNRSNNNNNNNNNTNSNANNNSNNLQSANVLKVTGGTIVSNGQLNMNNSNSTPSTGGSGGATTTATTMPTVTATALRALSAGGQSATQVRVVMPPGLMNPTVFKQLESGSSIGSQTSSSSGVGGANLSSTRTAQISGMPGQAHARSINTNAAITVARPLAQTAYLPRANISATGAQMTALNVGQRLLTPIRTTPTVSVSASGSGIPATATLVRTSSSASVSRNSTVTPPANNATWLTTHSTGGQVQLIRTIPQQNRQRIISTSGLTSGPSPAIVTTTSAGGHGLSNAVSGGSASYVGTLTSVMPQRAPQGSLVYTSNLSGSAANPVPTLTPTSTAYLSQQQQQQMQQQQQQQQHQQQQATSNILSGQAVSARINTATGPNGMPARQLRPIHLGKSFHTTARLSAASISIRTPTMPHLTPTNANTSNTSTGRGNATAQNLSTTARIIQLKQHPTSPTTPQIIGTSSRIGGNVMLQPIIVNSEGKISGFRPPVTMGNKGQPSLTITHVGLGKMPTSSTSTSTASTTTTVTGHMSSLIHSNAAGNISTNATLATSTPASSSHFMSSSGAVPVAIAARSASMAIAGSGSIYASNLTPISLNKAFMSTSNSAGVGEQHHVHGHHHHTTHHHNIAGDINKSTSNIYLHNASLGLTSMTQRSPITVVSGLTSLAAVETTTTTHNSSSNTTAATTTSGVATISTMTRTGTAATSLKSATTTASTSSATLSSSSSTTKLHTTTNIAITTTTSSTTTTTANTINPSSAIAATTTTTSTSISATTLAATSKPLTSYANNAIYYEPTAAGSSAAITTTLSSSTSKPSTFTVATNCSALRTIGPLHLPTATLSGTNVPIRLASSSSATSVNQSPITPTISINTTTTPVAASSSSSSIGHNNNSNNNNNNNSATATVLQVQPPPTSSTLHTIIPLQPGSLKMATTTATAVVTNFIRKHQPQQQQQSRDTIDGHSMTTTATTTTSSFTATTTSIAGITSTTTTTTLIPSSMPTVRAAKNLQPTLIAMGSSNNSSFNSNNNNRDINLMSSSYSPSSTYHSSSGGGGPNNSGTGVGGPSSSNSSTSSSRGARNASPMNNNNCNISALTMEALAAQNELNMIASNNSNNNNRCDSPLSSDGSTTVSANSSPGIEQMESHNSYDREHEREIDRDSTMHFNPINDLYAEYHRINNNNVNTNNINNNVNLTASSSGSSINSRMELPSHHHHQFHQYNNKIHHHHYHHSTSRYNGSNSMEYPPRKKNRLSNSDSLLSLHDGQQSASVGCGTSNNIGVSTDSPIDTGNGNNYSSSSSSSTTSVASNNSIYNGNGSDVESMKNGPIYNKENTKPPVEYVLNVRRHQLWEESCRLAAAKLPRNHFLKPTDVKPRVERKPTVVDIANEPNIFKRISGWKICHLNAQLDDLCETEYNTMQRLSTLLTDFENEDDPEETADMERLRDLVKGNMQRSQIILEGVQETQHHMLKILDHKPLVTQILTRSMSKRNSRKRDKT